jgi:uncharacterized protein (DUF486 family)
MNKILLYGLFICGVIISSIFYTLASYYFRIGEARNIKFIYIYAISIILALISYLIKIPVFYFLGKEMSIMIINITFLIISFIVVTLYSKFVLDEKIPFHTYIILTLIVLLILLNNILEN